MVLVAAVNWVLFRFRIQSKLTETFMIPTSGVVALILINCLYILQNFLVVASYLNSDRRLPQLLASLDAYDISSALGGAPSETLLPALGWAVILLYYFLVWDIVPYLIILFCLEIKWRFAELRRLTGFCLASAGPRQVALAVKRDAVLEELRLLHAELCRATSLLSDTFGFQLLVMFLNKYLNIVFTLYLGFFQRDMDIDGNIQVLVFDYVNAFIISFLSEKIDQESKMFETDLEVVKFDHLSKDAQIVVQLFLSQTRLRSIKINVCGFFILDRLLFSSMTVTLVTHFIVIMEMTPDLHRLLKGMVDPARYDGSRDPEWTKSLLKNK
ncbi:unnamed protein product [Bemisia tabaci]|uniref:Gustatory receptor n=1 Tax=Bemisia tabaci TaxID=7038 RepID=A0A9P0F8Q9_BEMTA|nr:unnamed protein product [Bemisia tabaci]